jgi:hypothetical protein
MQQSIVITMLFANRGKEFLEIVIVQQAMVLVHATMKVEKELPGN